MPRKKDEYSNHGEKLLRLFWMLLTYEKDFSLDELARMLKCSKQTVLRTLDEIQSLNKIEIEERKQGKKNYYKINSSLTPKKPIPISDPEIKALYMCKAFSHHLLGDEFFYNATKAIEKSLVLSQKPNPLLDTFFARTPGAIDYSVHQEKLKNIIKAMENKNICKINYKPLFKDARDYKVFPVKLLSHLDAIYVHGIRVTESHLKKKNDDFYILMAVHRINNVEILNETMEIPGDYDFNNLFDKTFGIIKGDEFKVTVLFSGYAAKIVSEKTLSHDQKITNTRDGNVKVEFYSSSEPEVISWILSFGKEARVISPKWLREEIEANILEMAKLYSKNIIISNS